VKKRIDILLFKSLEFIHASGQRVKVIDIPMLREDDTLKFMISARFEIFLSKIYSEKHPNTLYSFKDHLKRVLKWKDYERIFYFNTLKHNA